MIIETNWKKNAALFVGGQAITLLGSMIVQYAIFWYIMLETKSGSMMTIYAIVGILPMFLISPFGGVWADRFNRKFLINISDGVIAVVSLILAFLFMSGFTHLSILLACAGIRALGQGVQTPAVRAAIPQIVPVEHLTKINGIQSSVNSFCQLSAPMISAALMSFITLEKFFFLDVITALIGISVLAFFVKIPSLERKKDENKEIAYFHDIAEGWKYIKKHGLVLRLVIFLAIFMILISPAAFLTPLQIVRNFGDEVWRLSALEVVYAGGMLLGGIIIATWGGFKNKILTMAFAGFICGLATMFLGITPIFWLYIGIVIFWGISEPFFVTPMNVLTQTSVEPKFMGRVMSVFNMVESSMLPFSMLVFGPIADKISIDIILIVTGIAIMLLSFLILSNKTLRKAGKT